MRNSALFYRIFALGLAVVPFLAVEVPRILGFYPSIFGIIMSAWYVFVLKKKIKPHIPALTVISVICPFILLSCLWSLNPQDAFEKALLLSINLYAGVLFISLCRALNIDEIKPHLILLPSVMILTALFCCFEIYFDMPVYRIIHQAEYKFSSAVMNRGIITYCLCFFPILALIPSINIQKRSRHILYALYFCSMILLMMMTQSQSAQMGLAAGFIGFALFPVKKNFAYPVFAGMIAAAVLLTPLLVKLMFYHGFYGFAEISWLKDGYAGHRLEIWDFVINYAMHNPLYGYGLEATRYVENFEHGYLIHKQPTVLHPHNFSVQIWMEFGAIGATLACCIFTYVLYGIKFMPYKAASTAMALFLTILSISATGYGIWQAWWIGAILFSYALLQTGSENTMKNNHRFLP